MTTSVSVNEDLGGRARFALGDPRVAAVELMLPTAHIHPDPFQPRLDCDAELADSIKSQGVLQAISVEPAQPLDAVCEHCGNTFIELAALGHFMINDGERRWRGSIAAKQTQILAKVIAPTEEGDRLKRQLTANTGKPLSPIEEAVAFQRLMEVEQWSQVELAKQLGRPRATVGDRIRLLEIHPRWVELIVTGKLQLSHAPAMHRFREVPEKYQVQAIERLLSKGTGYGLGNDLEKGEPVRIDLFESRIRDCFRPFMRALSDVPGYDGPTIEFKDWDSRRKYAVDPDRWKPIRNAQIKRAREKRAKQGGNSESQPSAREYKSPAQIDVERLEKQGIPVKPTQKYHPAPEKGEVEIFSMRGFADNLDVETLLASVDRASLTIRRSTDRWNPQAIVVTADANAVALARAAYVRNLKAAAVEHCSKVLPKLTDAVLRAHAVTGPGARWLTVEFSPNRDSELFVLAMALQLSVDVSLEKQGDMAFTVVENADAEKLLSAHAAVSALGLKLPEAYRIRNDAAGSRHTLRLKLPELKSKSQQKREARARGEQVGDPSRAAVATA